MPFLRRFLRDPPALAGSLIVLAAILIALGGDHVVPFPQDAFQSHLLLRLKPPSAAHLLGTDHFGRDVLSRTLLGTGDALAIAMGVVAVSIAIGVPLGLFAGFFGGPVGEVIMRLTDIFLAVPTLILAIALAQLLQPGLGSAVIALGFTYWPHFCRSVYAETRSIRSAIFVEALESLGAGPLRIIFLHILPSTASPIIVRATIGMGYIIMMSAVLGFLGIGIPAPTPDWGTAIADSRQYLPAAWWLVTFPGLAIFLVVLGFNLIGDGLRDVIDPRLRRSR
ncbi:MAG TPA: ABC transporter permease [Beijerinckiaceae bacterium]|jgi:peptide/nickel transport system permease protein|nr:ABC transporter permease [Beijerinckiaceae bacterium]